MTVKTGRVEKTFEKEWNGRYGTVTLHSFQLEGDRSYYRTGEENFVKQGDCIKFAVDGKNNVDPDSVETVDAGEVPAAPAPRPAPKQGGGGYRKGGGQRDQYWEDKAKRDIEVVEPRIT